MKMTMKLAAAAFIGAAALAVTATSASAYVVCNQEGECWHVAHRYDYHPEFGLVVHRDGWRWHHGDNFRWREHRGRGYWRNGVWITF